jgi:hypothetical protein
MSVLRVNLKQLYQRRGLWVTYPFIAFIFWAGAMEAFDGPVPDKGDFTGAFVSVFLVGLLFAGMQMETLTKPFAFCLPGHRGVVRILIFLIGVVSNAFASLIFLWYPGLPGGYAPVILSSAFFAGLVFYFAGAWMTFGSGQPLAWVGLIMFAVFSSRLLSLNVLLEEAIVTMPLLVITLGVVATLAMWLYLSNEQLVRRNCLTPWIGFGAAFDPEKLRRFSQTKAGARIWERLKDHPRPWVQTLFLDHMGRHGPYSVARFVWGSLYVSFGVILSRWKNVLLVALFLAVFLGYMGGCLWVVAFIAPAMLLLQVRPALYSTLLIAGGRDQRLITTLTAIGVGSAFIALVIGLAMLASVPLATVIPDIEYRGLTLRYQPIGPRVFWVLVLLPLMSVIHLVFFKRPLAIVAAFMGLVYAVMFISLALSGPLGVPAGPTSAVALAIVLWVVCIVTAHRLAMRHDLVKR